MSILTGEDNLQYLQVLWKYLQVLAQVLTWHLQVRTPLILVLTAKWLSVISPFFKVLLWNENVIVIFDATFQNKTLFCQVSGDSSIFLWENVKRLKSSVKSRSKNLTASVAVSVVFQTTTSAQVLSQIRNGRLGSSKWFSCVPIRGI